ncbi:VRR-NUC domain-containing protein [Roseibium album]|uniref:VRR-NUC domain-containing protein n=1 Tax=Roseibium album TaxID=311410 RepID=UPI003BB1A8FF
MSEAPIHSYAKKRLQILEAQGKCVFYHVPNGLPRSNKYAAMLKNMGARNGVADFCIVIKGGRAAFMELKAPKGTQSNDQLRFQAECEKLGALYGVASTPEEVEELIRDIERISSEAGQVTPAEDTA